MFYRPPRTLGLAVGGALTLWAALVTIVLLATGLRAELGFVGLLAYVGAGAALLLAGLFAYWTFALATLSYALDRNGLVISWGATQQVIPLGAIERLVPGTAIGVPRVRGVTWWGYHIGRATIDRIGPVLFYSTADAPEQVLYVMTPERSYAVTVDDPAAFAQQIVRRQELGPTAELTHHVRRATPNVLALTMWYDRTALTLAGIAVAAGALVWLHVAARYRALPETFELHFPPTEATPLAEVVARSAILELPQTGAVILLLGLVAGALLHRWERMASYMVLGAATAVQAIFLVATLSVIP
ncbi:MAG: PH domain-containing protein [Chloroflexi bacterium]|nr:PH domain-containing protein [Chloroflexota bacterium]